MPIPLFTKSSYPQENHHFFGTSAKISFAYNGPSFPLVLMISSIFELKNMFLGRFTDKKSKTFIKITSSVAHCYKFFSKNPYPSLYKAFSLPLPFCDFWESSQYLHCILAKLGADEINRLKGIQYADFVPKNNFLIHVNRYFHLFSLEGYTRGEKILKLKILAGLRCIECQCQ